MYLIFRLYALNSGFRELYEWKVRRKWDGFFDAGIWLVHDVYRIVALYEIKIIRNQEDSFQKDSSNEENTDN